MGRVSKVTHVRMSRSLMGSRRGSFRDGSPESRGPERKISAPAGNYHYATPSYLQLQSNNKRKSAFRKYGCQKAPDAERPMCDPSLLYKRSTSGRDKSAKSEGPPGGMVNGFSANSVPQTPTNDGTTRVKKKSLANMFLPQNNEDAVLVLRKVSREMSRKSSFDSGIGLQEEDQKKGKKSVSKMATSDKHDQAKLTAELCHRLTFIAERMAALEKESEDIQQKQRTSNEFQIQVMKKSDAPDLEKGVTKVLDMVQFDRKQELSRLLKKVDDFKRRLARGTKLDGDDDELRDLLIA